MKVDNITTCLDAQREFFKSEKSKDINFRLLSLKKLRSMILLHEEDIAKALYQDLKKSYFEAYASEIGLVLNEINYHIKHLRLWTKTKSKPTPLTIFPSRSFIRQEPYGLTLIMAPWNYPFGLLMTPLVAAISAGNCAVLKPANYSDHTSKLILKLIRETFPQEYIAVYTGNRDVNKALLNERFDYIFFTGGSVLGKIVAKSAAEHLTPITLELGGKSPCIVDKDANLKRAARRIVWGKCLNLGQTCIAPDHLYVHSEVRVELLKLIKRELQKQFGPDLEKSPDLGRIINEKAFNRLESYLKDAHILSGGKRDKGKLYIEPTLIEADENMPVMKEEIFGPILPVIEFKDIVPVIDSLKQKEKPLALYYFTSSKAKAESLMTSIDSGGVCINDVVIQYANSRIPFGGTGNSGMGSYHGKYSFDTFSRQRGGIKTPTLFDLPVKFAPYNNKIKLLKKFL